MNISPESLPDNVVAASREAWAAGEHHLALSLLYRGAISALLERDLVDIGESFTEADCLRQVRAQARGLLPYFEKLSVAWLRLAYGRKPAGEDEMADLWRDWPFAGKNLQVKDGEEAA